MALLVPAVMRYIDRAKDRQIMADARSVYIAVQAVASDYYGSDKLDATDFAAGGDLKNIVETPKIEIETLSGIPGSKGTITGGTVSFTTGEISGFEYTDKKTLKAASYDGTSWTVK